MVGLICLLSQKWTLAILTSLIGAFLSSYFLGYVIGVLPNFADIIERIKTGDKLEPAYYVFFSLFIVLTIIGMIVQFKSINAQKKNNDLLQTDLIEV